MLRRCILEDMNSQCGRFKFQVSDGRFSAAGAPISRVTIAVDPVSQVPGQWMSSYRSLSLVSSEESNIQVRKCPWEEKVKR